MGLNEREERTSDPESMPTPHHNVLTAVMIAARSAEKRVLMRQQRMAQTSPTTAKLFVLHWLTILMIAVAFASCCAAPHPILLLLTAAALLTTSKVIPAPDHSKIATCTTASCPSTPAPSALPTRASGSGAKHLHKKDKLVLQTSAAVSGRDPAAYCIARRALSAAIAGYCAAFVVALIVFQIVFESSPAVRESYAAARRGPSDLVDVSSTVSAAFAAITENSTDLNYTDHNAVTPPHLLRNRMRFFAVPELHINFFHLFGIFAAASEPYRFALALLPPIGLLLIALTLARLTPPRFIYYAPKEPPQDPPHTGTRNTNASSSNRSTGARGKGVAADPDDAAHTATRQPEPPRRHAPRIAIGTVTALFAVGGAASVALPTLITAPILLAVMFMLGVSLRGAPPRSHAVPSVRLAVEEGATGRQVPRQLFVNFYVFEADIATRCRSIAIAFLHYWCVVALVAIIGFQNPVFEGFNDLHFGNALNAHLPTAGSLADATRSTDLTLTTLRDMAQAVVTTAPWPHGLNASALPSPTRGVVAVLSFAGAPDCNGERAGSEAPGTTLAPYFNAAAAYYAELAARDAHFSDVASRWYTIAGLINAKHYYWDASLTQPRALRDLTSKASEAADDRGLRNELLNFTACARVTADAVLGELVAKNGSSTRFWQRLVSKDAAASLSPQFYLDQDVATRALVQAALLLLVIFITRSASASIYYVPVDYPVRNAARAALHRELEPPRAEEGASDDTRVCFGPAVADGRGSAQRVVRSTNSAQQDPQAVPPTPLMSRISGAAKGAFRALHRLLFLYSPYITPVALIIFSVASPTIFCAVVVVPFAFLFSVATSQQLNQLALVAYIVQSLYTVALHVVFAGALWDVSGGRGVDTTFKLLFFGELRQLTQLDLNAVNFQLGTQLLCALVVGLSRLLVVASRRDQRLRTQPKRDTTPNARVVNHLAIAQGDAGSSAVPPDSSLSELVSSDVDNDTEEGEEEGEEESKGASMAPRNNLDQHMDGSWPSADAPSLPERRIGASPGDRREREALVALLARIEALTAATLVLGRADVTKLAELLELATMDGGSRLGDEALPVEGDRCTTGGMPGSLRQPPLREVGSRLSEAASHTYSEQQRQGAMAALLHRLAQQGASGRHSPLAVACGPAFHDAVRMGVLPAMPSVGWRLTPDEYALVRSFVDSCAPSIGDRDHAVVREALTAAVAQSEAAAAEGRRSRASSTGSAAHGTTPTVGLEHSTRLAASPLSSELGISLGAAVLLLHREFADIVLLCAAFRDGCRGLKQARDAAVARQRQQRFSTPDLWRMVESALGLSIEGARAPDGTTAGERRAATDESAPGQPTGSTLPLSAESFLFGTMNNLSFSFAAPPSPHPSPVEAPLALHEIGDGTNGSVTRTGTGAHSTFARAKHQLSNVIRRMGMGLSNLLLTTRMLLFRLFVVDMVVATVALFAAACYRKESNLVGLTILTACVASIWAVTLAVRTRWLWFKAVVAIVVALTEVVYLTAVMKDEIGGDAEVKQLIGVAGFESSYWELCIFFGLFLVALVQHNRLAVQAGRLELRQRILQKARPQYGTPRLGDAGGADAERGTTAAAVGAPSTDRPTTTTTTVIDSSSSSGSGGGSLEWDEIRGEIEWRQLRASDFFAKLQMYCMLLLAAPIFLFLENFSNSTYIVALFLILFIILSCVSTVHPTSFLNGVLYRLWFVVALVAAATLVLLGAYQVPMFRDELRADLASRAWRGEAANETLRGSGARGFLRHCDMDAQQGISPPHEALLRLMNETGVPLPAAAEATATTPYAALAAIRDGWLAQLFAEMPTGNGTLDDDALRQLHQLNWTLASQPTWSVAEHRAHACLREIGLVHSGERTSIASMAPWFVVALLGVLQFVALRKFNIAYENERTEAERRCRRPLRQELGEGNEAEASAGGGDSSACTEPVVIEQQSYRAASDSLTLPQAARRPGQVRGVRAFVAVLLWFVGHMVPVALWVVFVVAALLQKSIATSAYLAFFLLDWRGRIPLLYSAVHLLLLYAYPLTLFPAYWSEQGMGFIGISKDRTQMSSVGEALIGPALVFLGTQLHANTTAERRAADPPFDIFRRVRKAARESGERMPARGSPLGKLAAWYARHAGLLVLELMVFLFTDGLREFGFELLLLTLLVAIAETQLLMATLLFSLTFVWFVVRGRNAVRRGKSALRGVSLFFSLLLAVTYWFAVRTPRPDSINGAEALFMSRDARIEAVGAENHLYSYVRWVGGHPEDTLLVMYFVVLIFLRVLLREADDAVAEEDETFTMVAPPTRALVDGDDEAQDGTGGGGCDEETAHQDDHLRPRTYTCFTDVLRDFAEELRLARRKNLVIDFVVPVSSTHPERRTIKRLESVTTLADALLLCFCTLFVAPILVFIDGLSQPSVLHIFLVLAGLLLMRYRRRVFWAAHRVWPKLVYFYCAVILVTAIVNIPSVGRLFVRFPEAPAALGFLSADGEMPMEVTYWRVFAIWTAVLQLRVFQSFAFLGLLRRMHAKALATNARHEHLKRVLQQREEDEDRAASERTAHHRKLLDELHKDFAAITVSSPGASGAPTLPQPPIPGGIALMEASVEQELGHEGRIGDADEEPPVGVTSEEREVSGVVDGLLRAYITFMLNRSYRGSETTVGVESRVAQVLLATWAFLLRHTADVCFILFSINFAVSGTVFDGLLSFFALTHGAVFYPWPSKRYWIATVTYIVAGIGIKSLTRFIAAQVGISSGSSRAVAIFFVDLEEHDGIKRTNDRTDMAIIDLALDFLCLLAVLVHLRICSDHGVYTAGSVDDGARGRQKADDVGSETDDDAQSVATELETDSDDEHMMMELLRGDQGGEGGCPISGGEGHNTGNPSGERMSTPCDDAATCFKHPAATTAAAAAASNGAAESGDAASLPARMLSNVKRISGSGRDNYTICFVLELCALFYSMFAYFSLAGRASGSFVQAIEQNLLPGPLVVLLLLLVLVMVVDRILYTLSASKSETAMLAKFGFHVCLMAAYHGFYVYWVADIAATAAGGAVLLMLKVLYGMLAAHQLRYGYPMFRHHDPFTRSAHWVFETMYIIYRQVPFLWDLRMMLDWPCTRTTLNFQSFLKVEDIGHEVYRRYARRKYGEETNPRKGTTHPFKEKLVNGVAMFVLIMFIMFFPLMYYSAFNPRLRSNPATLFEAQLTLTGHEVLFTASQSAAVAPINDPALRDSIAKVYPSSVTDEFLGEERDLQLLELASCSRTLWSASPSSTALLMRKLHALAESNAADAAAPEPVELDFEFRIVRSVSIGTAGTGGGGEAGKGSDTLRTTFAVDAEAARALRFAINASLHVSGDGGGGGGGEVGEGVAAVSAFVPPPVLLRGVYDPMIFNVPSETVPYSRMKGLPPERRSIDCQLTLRREVDTASGSNVFVRFWCVECQGLFSRGNTPFIGGGSGAEEYAERDCAGDAQCLRQRFNYDDATSAPARARHVNGSGIFVAVASDRVPSDFNLIPIGTGIVAFYTGLIFALSSVIRASLTGMAHRVVLEEVADPRCLAELIAYIYLARGGGSQSAASDLELEETLYLQLIDLMRSPDLLLRRSGQQSNGMYNAATGQRIPIDPRLRW